MIRQLTAFVHSIAGLYLREGMNVVDATVGNGHDALYLCQSLRHSGHLYGFDIQSTAIQTTAARLREQGYENFTLFNTSHSNMIEMLGARAIDFFIYNLGYLPNGDKEVTTQWESTVSSLNQATEMLKLGGIIMVIVYPGHDSGEIEATMLETWGSALNPQVYHVMKLAYLNQYKDAPYGLIIEKKASIKR